MCRGPTFMLLGGSQDPQSPGTIAKDRWHFNHVSINESANKLSEALQVQAAAAPGGLCSSSIQFVQYSSWEKHPLSQSTH